MSWAAEPDPCPTSLLCQPIFNLETWATVKDKCPKEEARAWLVPA